MCRIAEHLKYIRESSDAIYTASIAQLQNLLPELQVTDGLIDNMSGNQGSDFQTDLDYNPYFFSDEEIKEAVDQFAKPKIKINIGGRKDEEITNKSNYKPKTKEEKEAEEVAERAKQNEKWKRQVETTRLYAFDKAEDTARESMSAFKDYQRHGESSRCLGTLSKIIKIWQDRAGNENPSRYAIQFKNATTRTTLLHIFALLPDDLQKVVVVKDKELKRYGNPSWLHENMMDVLLHVVGAPKAVPTIEYGRELANSVNCSMDDVYKKQYGHKTYLKYLRHLMETGHPSADWNPNNVFTFPPDTSEILYFWNYNEVHWTTIQSRYDGLKWTHMMYDSMSRKYKVYSADARAFREQMRDIEELIGKASGFERPRYASSFFSGWSPQQKNIDDCGVIAVYNAHCLLTGHAPNTGTKARGLRSVYMEYILHYLETEDGAAGEEKQETETDAKDDAAGGDESEDIVEANDDKNDGDDEGSEWEGIDEIKGVESSETTNAMENDRVVKGAKTAEDDGMDGYSEYV